MKLKIEQIRLLSQAYAEGLMPRKKPHSVQKPDERWIEAYGDAIFVCGYKGWCTFELDGIRVTIIESADTLRK